MSVLPPLSFADIPREVGKWVHVRMDHVQCFQCKRQCGILLKSSGEVTGGLLGQLQNPRVGPSEVEDIGQWGRTFSWHQRSPDTSRKGSLALLPQAGGTSTQVCRAGVSMEVQEGSLLDHCGEEKAEASQCVTMVIKQHCYVACQPPAAAMKLTVGYKSTTKQRELSFFKTY